ncbi:MAG: glycosyltransferase family 4 protein [Myxococcales bacterium]
MPKGRVLLLYHFFHPDDVVSAQHFSDLALGLSARGWQVTALTSDRSCRDPGRRYSKREDWNGIDIVRVHRPGWDQSRAVTRLLNSAWMVIAWFFRSLTLGSFDAVVVGTDPAFAPLLLLPLRIVRPATAFVVWSFDLYPEAIASEGMGRGASVLVPVAKWLMGLAYRCCQVLVDLGPRMKARLAGYRSGARQETLVPWALVEPGRLEAPVPAVRAELFPRGKLALLYSGTMGRAHEYELLLRLARRCRDRSGDDISICFACRGNRVRDLRDAVRPDDTNIHFAPFADVSELGARLTSADLHLLGLRPEWAGVVVPSKFFGSLAVGRPVLYAGPRDSEIAVWIEQHDVGLVLTGENLDEVVDVLHEIQREPARLERWRQNALRAYRQVFAKSVSLDLWDRLLGDVATRSAPTPVVTQR